MKVTLRRFYLFFLRYISSLGIFAYSLTFGVMSKRGRDFLRIACRYYNFGYAAEKAIPKLKKVGIEHVLDSIEGLSFTELETTTGNISPLALMVLTALIRKHKPQNIFEIGTYDGRTTLNLAMNCGPSGKVFTLDLPPEMVKSVSLRLENQDHELILDHRIGSRYSKFENSRLVKKGQIVQLYGDSATFDFSQLYDSMDFVFIDGSHHYDYVINDSNIALRLLRDGKGVIVWDDYDNWNGVTRGLEYWLNSHPEIRAIHIDGTKFVYGEVGYSIG